MEEETQKSENWRDDISDSSGATLKILDGESKIALFLSEGKKITSADYGTSIVFEVEFEKEKMNFYVKENNYSLLKQFKEIGNLVGKAIKISRVGSKKSDTRYTIEEVKPIE